MDENNVVVSRNGRLEAAKRRGLEIIPNRPDQPAAGQGKKAYALAANKIAGIAGWDNLILLDDLNDLGVFGPEPQIDADAIGFFSRRVRQDQGRSRRTIVRRRPTTAGGGDRSQSR